MSIASAIANAQTKVANAYSAVNTKGGTLPVTQNLTNLPTAINSIPSGGSSPVISSLSITPSTSAQTFNANNVDGYKPVTVSAVTSSIDSNITAGNIKNGVSILGVTGNYSGTTPSGTLPITANGVYDVTNYASANVSVSGGSSNLSNLYCWKTGSSFGYLKNRLVYTASDTPQIGDNAIIIVSQTSVLKETVTGVTSSSVISLSGVECTRLDANDIIF